MLFFVQLPKFDYPDDLRQLVARIALVQAVNEQKQKLLYSLRVRTIARQITPADVAGVPTESVRREL
jgi:hypothetical protein